MRELNFSRRYASLFGRGRLAKVNDRLLSYALSARGYDNYRNNQESGESFFIREVLAPTDPKLCIDVGANIGAYTYEILRHTNASVIAFEPLPDAFVTLSETTKFHSGRVVLENKGVGRTVEDRAIHFSPSSPAHASFSEDVKKVPYILNEQKTDVPVVTLDSYCEANGITEIDLVKIDTEGYESEVFEGAKKTFAEVRPNFVQIEFNWHQMFRNTSLNFFAEKLPNYALYQLIPKGWVRRDARDPLSNIYLFSNFVFVLQD